MTPTPPLKDPAAAQVYRDVLVAMQNADELGGPEGMAYVALMLAISTEALKRASACFEALDIGTSP